MVCIGYGSRLRGMVNICHVEGGFRRLATPTKGAQIREQGPTFFGENSQSVWERTARGYGRQRAFGGITYGFI